MIELDDDTVQHLATDSPYMPKPLYVAQEIVMAAIQGAQRPTTCAACEHFEDDDPTWCSLWAADMKPDHFCADWEARP